MAQQQQLLMVLGAAPSPFHRQVTVWALQWNGETAVGGVECCAKPNLQTILPHTARHAVRTSSS